MTYMTCRTNIVRNRIDESENSHGQVYGGQPHEGKLSHELIAGAASFEAFKAFEDHRRAEGMSPLSPVTRSLPSTQEAFDEQLLTMV